jgi:hypothetical protein
MFTIALDFYGVMSKFALVGVLMMIPLQALYRGYNDFSFLRLRVMVGQTATVSSILFWHLVGCWFLRLVCYCVPSTLWWQSVDNLCISFMTKGGQAVVNTIMTEFEVFTSVTMKNAVFWDVAFFSIMTLRLLKRADNLLSNWASAGFSSKILFHGGC